MASTSRSQISPFHNSMRAKIYPLRSVSVRRPTGLAAAWYTRGRRRDMAVTTSHVLVVRSCANRSAPIRSAPIDPSRTNSSRAVDRAAGDVGHVGHDRIHRDVPDERHAPPADDGAGAVRERPRPAVAVAERERRDPARPRRPEGRAVAHARAGRQVRDADRPGDQGHRPAGGWARGSPSGDRHPARRGPGRRSPARAGRRRRPAGRPSAGPRWPTRAGVAGRPRRPRPPRRPHRSGRPARP